MQINLHISKNSSTFAAILDNTLFIMLGKLIKNSLVFAAGAAVGAGVLWLMSEDGKETREQLRDIADKAKQKMEEYYEQAKQEKEAKDETANPA